MVQRESKLTKNSYQKKDNLDDEMNAVKRLGDFSKMAHVKEKRVEEE